MVFLHIQSSLCNDNIFYAGSFDSYYASFSQVSFLSNDSRSDVIAVSVKIVRHHRFWCAEARLYYHFYLSLSLSFYSLFFSLCPSIPLSRSLPSHTHTQQLVSLFDISLVNCPRGRSSRFPDQRSKQNRLHLHLQYYVEQFMHLTS